MLGLARRVRTDTERREGDAPTGCMARPRDQEGPMSTKLVRSEPWTVVA